LSPKTVELFYFDAGGGHRNAMNVLSRQLSVLHPDWLIIPVDLQKLLEPIDPVYRMTLRLTGSLKRFLAPRFTLSPIQAQDIYNTALKRGATRGMGAILPILQGFVRRYSPQIEALLEARWRRPEIARPDLVISVIPNFNGVLFGALRRFDTAIPYLTVITDMVDCPPHFWMEDQDQYMVCGTQKAFEQAVATGFYAPEKIFRVSGMLLKESFYAAPAAEGLTRASLGLDPGKPTALIMFGGNGSLRSTLAILSQFERSRLDIQTIVLCGHNAKLAASLKDRPNCHPVGFITNVADYIRLADFLIGKPGPGSISEAVHLGRPVIVEGNATTMPQERPNVKWVRDNDVGIVVRSFRKEIVGAAERMLGDLDRYRANIANNIPENRAVFEVAEIIEGVAMAAHLPSFDRATQPRLPLKPSRLSPRAWLGKSRIGRFRA
jgi:1,2-diacylglycerol 3-beta-galactosyltransferase